MGLGGPRTEEHELRQSRGPVRCPSDARRPDSSRREPRFHRARSLGPCEP